MFADDENSLSDRKFENEISHGQPGVSSILTVHPESASIDRAVSVPTSCAPDVGRDLCAHA